MRLLVTVFVITLTCAGMLAAQVVSSPGTMPAAPGAGPMDDPAFDACLARSLGMTLTELYSYRAQNMRNSDLAIASAIARQANQPVATVIAQYRLQPDWNTVAQTFQVDYGALALSEEFLSPDDVIFNEAFISQQYNVPVTEVRNLRNQGYGWGETNMIINASARTGLTPQQVAQMRQQGMTWQSIASRYNLPVTTLTVPCPVTAPRLSCSAALAAGPVCTRPVTPAMYDNAGNVLLTQDEVMRFYSKGYDWTEVAIAANIARETGYPVDQVLRDMRSGMVWQQVAQQYGVAPDVAFNICTYPFERTSIYSPTTEAKNLERIARYQTTPIAGAGPLNPPMQPGADQPVY